MCRSRRWTRCSRPARRQSLKLAMASARQRADDRDLRGMRTSSRGVAAWQPATPLTSPQAWVTGLPLATALQLPSRCPRPSQEHPNGWSPAAWCRTVRRSQVPAGSFQQTLHERTRPRPRTLIFRRDDPWRPGAALAEACHEEGGDLSRVARPERSGARADIAVPQREDELAGTRAAVRVRDRHVVAPFDLHRARHPATALPVANRTARERDVGAVDRCGNAVSARSMRPDRVEVRTSRGRCRRSVVRAHLLRSGAWRRLRGATGGRGRDRGRPPTGARSSAPRRPPHREPQRA